MKSLFKLFFSLLFLIANVAAAQTASTTSPSINSLTTLVQKVGDVRSSAAFKSDCLEGIALDSCVSPVTPPGCPVGKYWTTMGSGIAHCVDVDPVCSSGTVLQHDWLGNPKCVAVSYVTDRRYSSCPDGQTGVYTEKRTSTYVDGVLISSGDWIFDQLHSDCVNEVPLPPEPTPTCPNGAPFYPFCILPEKPPVAPVTPPTSSNPPVIPTPGGTAPTPQPQPETCTASDVVVNSSPCPSGQQGGPINTHTTVTCPGNRQGSYTSGTCQPAVCENGATNWPLCNNQPVKCPPLETYCRRVDINHSGDPRDETYEWGWIRYVGPTCEMEWGNVGSNSVYSGGCPAGW